MENKLNNIKTLDKLFAEWKKKQAGEGDESFKSYEYRNVSKESFDPDGIIDEDEYRLCESGKRILFIAKEGNIGGSSDHNTICKNNDQFWLRCVVNRIADYKQNLFSRRIAMLYNAFSMNNYQHINKNHDRLRSAAFMNLNKRGGYTHCNDSVLEAYTERYAEYIAEEIEIIKPNVIICCGRIVKELLEKHVVHQLKYSPRLVEVYHPSHFRISDAEYLRLFNQAINGGDSKSDLSSINMPSAAVPEKAEASDNIKGIIFDTDVAHEPRATDEMLSRVSDDPCAAAIMAFGSARKTLRYFRKGDYVYYYYKGVGIIAVGIVEDEPDSFEDVYERKVRLIVEPVKKNGEYIGVKADSEFKGLATRKTGGFWLYGTTKKPYIYGKENNERAANEIRKKIAAAKN